MDSIFNLTSNVQINRFLIKTFPTIVVTTKEMSF